MAQYLFKGQNLCLELQIWRENGGGVEVGGTTEILAQECPSVPETIALKTNNELVWN